MDQRAIWSSTVPAEQEVGVAPAPDWRAEFEQVRAELQALRERVQQLKSRKATRLSAIRR